MANQGIINLFTEENRTIRQLHNGIDRHIYPYVDETIEQKFRNQFNIARSETVLYTQIYSKNHGIVPCEIMGLVITDVAIRFCYYDPMNISIFAFNKHSVMSYDQSSQAIVINDTESKVDVRASIPISCILNTQDSGLIDQYGEYFAGLFQKINNLTYVEPMPQNLYKNYIIVQKEREDLKKIQEQAQWVKSSKTAYDECLTRVYKRYGLVALTWILLIVWYNSFERTVVVNSIWTGYKDQVEHTGMWFIWFWVGIPVAIIITCLLLGKTSSKAEREAYENAKSGLVSIKKNIATSDWIEYYQERMRWINNSLNRASRQEVSTKRASEPQGYNITMKDVATGLSVANNLFKLVSFAFGI